MLFVSRKLGMRGKKKEVKRRERDGATTRNKLISRGREPL